MGSPPDEPGQWPDEIQHWVTLTRDFYMQTTEVTQGQWEAVMEDNPSHFKDCGDDCPVEMVSWNSVQEFITKLNKMGEGTYRLPTEAEWEYACRAETDTPFFFGRCLPDDQSNYDGTRQLKGCETGKNRGKTLPVASFSPNAWGLYDMHGNVWEWCQDWYGNYPDEPVTDPAGPDTGLRRVNRGGGWDDYSRTCRSAFRFDDPPFYYDSEMGFRLVRSKP